MKTVKKILNEFKNIGWEEYAVGILALTSAYLWIIGAALQWW
tara:strand:+ start:857 stop:982 length:126 start_codon:yes stop_codon:yes gene_type:complete